VNVDKVCTFYTERDPEIVKKRQRQGKSLTVHVTMGFIEGHEWTHIYQMLNAFDSVIADLLSSGINPKAKSFPNKLRKKLKEAYQKFKRDNARGYPHSPTEREARQKALEKWDRHKKNWSLGHGSLGAYYGSGPGD